MFEYSEVSNILRQQNIFCATAWHKKIARSFVLPASLMTGLLDLLWPKIL